MKFTESHEWLILTGQTGRVGISNYAKEELGEVVYIELPKVGQKVEAGEEIVVIESTKAAADIYSPVSGVITAVNLQVAEDPNLLSSSPEKEGWLFEITLSDMSELDTLLDHEQYLQLIT